MIPWRRGLARVRELMSSRRIDRDLRDELESHLAHLTDDFIRRGLTPQAARQRARRALGGLDQTTEAVRDNRGIPMLEHVIVDIRRAVRSLVKAPSFTIVAIVTLALGIGANTAIFSVLDGVVLRPLPYADAGRLVSIFEANVGQGPENSTSSGSIIGGNDDPGRMAAAPANFVDYQARAKEFSGIAGLARVSMTLTSAGEPRQLIGEDVTPNYFSVLGAAPMRGRPLSIDDAKPGAAAVVVISHGLWQEQFGSDESIVGRTISLNDSPREVVGVMPATFTAVSQFGVVDPVSFWTPAYYTPELLANHADHEINLVARLAPGVTMDAASRSIAAISDALGREFPTSNAKLRAHVRPLGDDLVRSVRTSLVVIMMTVGLILLIACVNVANLLIVRGAGKRREVAVRYALGASRGRVVSEMVTESLVLAAAACLVGLALAWWMKGVLVALAPQSLPRLSSVALDARAIGCSAGLALATGLLFGLLPAWQARAARPVDAMGSGGRAVTSRWMMRWRNGLMVAEVAVSTVLLVGAGLMVKSLTSLNAVDLGFRTDHILAMNVSLPTRRYKTADDRFMFFTKLEQQLTTVPGITRVGFANRFPMRGGWESGVQIDGVTLAGDAFVDANFQAVSPGYFDTLGLRLTRGRLLMPSDITTSEPVAVVSEAFSTKLLGGADPVGRRMRRAPSAPWITVVGVIADIRRDGKAADINPQVYLSAAQTTLYPVRLADIAVVIDPHIANTSGISTALRSAVWAIDKDQPVSNVRTLEEVVATDAKNQRFQATLIGLFAALALTLAIVGIYGVVSYVVTQRTPEIGIRMALGANRWAILRWLLTGTLALVVVGTGTGTVGAILMSKYVASLLFQVKATDAATYLSAGLLLSVVAMVAAALAAGRATRIDPVRALRSE